MVPEQYLENLSFVYSMTGDAAHADAAKTWAFAIAGWDYWGDDWTASFMGMSMSFAYDALFEYLTPAERATLSPC